MSRTDQHDDVLEQNVSTLIESGGEPPRITDIARARIKAHLVEKHGTQQAAPKRSPMIAVGIGLVATAAAALIVTRFVGGSPSEHPEAGNAGKLADGSFWIVEPGGNAKVDVIGPRRVRVTGAALLDVAPGKGTFVVETTRGTIEVLGTRFLVDADAERTTTAVVRGQVKLATPSGDVLLHAGEQGVAEPGRPPTRGPAPRLTHLVSWVAAARRRDEHQVVPLRNGTLFAREPNNPHVPESPLPIEKLVVDVTIEDQVARVAIDQTFHNPKNIAMEGMYRFAIPPDAALQRLAMYVDGQLQESAVVERMRARRIYEEIVYRRMDPALLEWAGTGRLNLRVYPLPPNEDKRLLVAYTQSLPKLYDDWTLAVPLPEVDLPVGELGFDVRVRGCANCELSSPSHAVTVTREGDDAIVKYASQSGKRERLGDSFVLHVRDARRQAVIGRQDDFLLVRARPDLRTVERPYHQRSWIILDDVSASRGPTELRAQQDLVDAFMRELDEQDRVAVVAFDVDARVELPLTRVMDVDRKNLRAALKDEGGVGATNFAAALAAATKLLDGVAADDAMIVYLGDGVITTGPKNLDALRTQLAGKAHFVGVGVGDGPDIQTLDSLAAATGGYSTTIDLADDVGWRAFDLVAALHTPRVTDLSAKLVDATGALVPSTAYLKTPQLADGEELELVAKLAGGGTAVAAIVTGKLNGQPWEQKIALDHASSSAGYLPRLWAQRHIAARLLAKHEAVSVPPCVLAAPAKKTGRAAPVPDQCPTEAELREKRDEAIRQEVIALGKQYFLLSRHTSLIVLENDKMYAQYQVTKGSGDTWAPYKVPQKIEVKKTPAIVAMNIADDAELVRSPLRVFYDYGGEFEGRSGGFDGVDDDAEWAFHSTLNRERRLESGGLLDQTRGDLRLADPQFRMGPTGDAQRVQGEIAPQSTAQGITLDLESMNNPLGGGRGYGAGGGGKLADDKFVETKTSGRKWVTTDQIVANDGWGSRGAFVTGQPARLRRTSRYSSSPQLYPQRFTYPGDSAFDDLSNFIPALFGDETDALRTSLTENAPNTRMIDPAAKALLDNARRALPVGTLRWGDTEFAIDGAHHFGWRRTTGADLVETASYDGTAWLRRYAELGVDVTRTLAEDDIAVAFAYLPIWIAEPAHYARYFDVKLKNPRTVTLAQGATVVFELAFDDSHHLVAVRDGAGNALLAVAWGAHGPISATTGDRTLDVGFTAQSIDSVAAWAHGASTPGVVVELPSHMATYWTARLEKLTAGTPEWRHAQRQSMVSFAATNQWPKLFEAYEALRKNGGAVLGDVTLASAGIATADNTNLAAALAPVANTPVARYLIASRAFRGSNVVERLRAETQTGFIGALWTVREAIAQYQAGGKPAKAIDRLLSLGERAFDLRLVATAVITQNYNTKPEDIARAWDAVARGEYRNIARAQAAVYLANRGNYDAAAERVVALVNDLDLAAAPPQLASMQWQFQSSRRGNAGWQLVWATWRDRALAGGNFEHVVALLPAAQQHPVDLPAVLARAAELAKGDTSRVLEVAELATNYGQPTVAQQLVEPIVKATPTRALLQFAGGLAARQNRLADALAYYEQAQQAGADEAVDLVTVRNELGQIIGTAGQLAQQSQGAPRQAAVQKATMWATRWRAIDPGNDAIDQQLGEIYLSVGDTAAAWRQLSSVIERSPMEGTGYTTVAEAFERQGRVVEAIDYWHQAVVIDQTNPTHRLREAQALIAVGRTAEGDAILNDIATRKWHVRWDGITYQAKNLLERGRRANP